VAKLIVMSMCDNPVAAATVETAAMIDSKGKAALAKKITNQETVQGQLNHYISNPTETNLYSDNGIEFWSE